jgi:hypothetical protein
MMKFLVDVWGERLAEHERRLFAPQAIRLKTVDPGRPERAAAETNAPLFAFYFGSRPCAGRV